ncbi:MAG: hypothetical protein ACAI25_19555 [Planctomycetota bacterium]
MPMNYCEVCGVLIANAPPGTPTSICETCFAQRKVIVTPGSGSAPDQATEPPDRVQFSCPACKSLLQLPPVRKRTRIKCPHCRGDFAMYPDGKIERATANTQKFEKATPSAARIEQEKLLGDLKPLKELDDLLARVPEKKRDVMPDAMSDAVPFDSNSASAQPDVELEMHPEGVGPGEAAETNTQDYVLLPDSGGEPDFPESKELDPVKPDGPKQQPKKIQTARRTKDQVYQQRKEKELRAQRAADAQKYTLALIEKRHQKNVKTLKLLLIVFLPLIPGALLLMSTTQEAGFAVRGGLGRTLHDVGETARRGVEGVLSLTGHSK